MAKGDKKAKKGKDKVKVPKRIAGVKVPKAVRQAGKSALKLRRAAGGERDGGGGPARGGGGASRSAGDEAGGRRPRPTRAGEAGQEAIGLGDSLRKMAIDMARRTLDAWESADSKPARAQWRRGHRPATADRG